MRRRLRLLLAATAVAALPLGTAAAEPAAVRVIAQNLAYTWGVGFLPDGSALVTERNSARVLSIKGTAVSTAATIPGVRPGGEGGLLGIAVSPNYASDGWIFVYYTSASDNRIARFKLGQAPQPIVTGIPKANIHNGGRLAFGPDGHLYAGTGDAANTANSQNPNSLGGKILRMTLDGKPAPGNPSGTLVYTLGHRNVQGLAWDSRGRMFASELGQNRQDELNQIVAGSNYGWPTCEGRCNDTRFRNPLLTWTTAEASPSGIAVYNNNVYVTALRGQRLWKVPLTDSGVGNPTALYQGTYGRLRDAAVAPDRTLWVLTSNGPSGVAGGDKVLSTDG
ncbi:PQQ-dependent sugar dehydrogenase [Crossiella sp. SN42]|uniref:PQQ-dependent sugar dehydrogenase n=1 Tax=Crossiella sp. SN42 TaxID=2944808 RepID=UPI00207C6BDF|nr:PQQ-dependent sugar dehydrogenase [Crossiella sp. SN42]MCO1578848.1 PQQ-dependent sugar dehydrogenase [Crossiella sp. SN42]